MDEGQDDCASGGIVAPELVSDGAEAPAATAVQLLQDAQEQARLREEAAAERERQAAVAQKRKEEQTEADAISSEARIAIDDVWTIYNDIPRKRVPTSATT